MKVTKEKKKNVSRSKLFEDIDIVEIDPLSRQDYQITEEQLNDRIKVILLEIKNKYS